MSDGRRLPTLSHTFGSFRYRNFRLYFGGLFVSNIGTWLQTTVLAWVVLQRTDNGVALGGLAAAQWGPMLVLGAWGGAVSDRVDKRRLILVTQLGAACQSAALAVCLALGIASLPVIFVLAALLGLINAVDNPTRRGFIPQLVPDHQIANAMALNTSVMTSTRIVGPALGGLLLSRIGAAWCVTANAVSFAATIVGIVALDGSELQSAPLIRRAKGQITEGVRYAWTHPVLRVSLLSTAVLGVLAYNYQTTFSLFAKRVLVGDASTFGTLLSVTSIGSLLGSLVVASRFEATPRFLRLAAGAFGLALLALSAAPSLSAALVLTLPVGAAGSAFISTGSGLLQRLSRPEMRGRLMALQAVVLLGSTPVGGLLVGGAAELAGARAGLWIGGIAGVVTAACMPLLQRLGRGANPVGATVSDPSTA